MLQKALQRFAKSWRQRRALEVFRDETGLSVDPDLWRGIAQALDAADWFIYLASPDAARSVWVGKEIDRWRQGKDPYRILIVLTDGDWCWDSAAQDFDPARSTAIHPALKGAFSSEPHVLDMRWAHHVDRLTLQHPRFRDCVASIAAPLHGRPKDDLEDEDTRNQRHLRRLSRAAILVLVLLLAVASVASVFAMQQRNEARRQLLVAQARQLAATSATLLGTRLDQAMLLAVQAYSMHHDEQTRRALYQAALASPHLVRYYDAGSTVTALEGSADGELIVAGLADGRVLAWDSRRPGRPQQITRFDDAVTVIGVSRAGEVIVASDGATLYRSNGGRAPDVPKGVVVAALAVSPSGRSLAVYERPGPGSDRPSRTILERSGRVQHLPASEIRSANWDEMTFRGDDRLILYARDGGTWKVIRLRPTPQVESEANLGFDSFSVTASAMSPDGRFVTYAAPMRQLREGRIMVPVLPMRAGRGDLDIGGRDLIGESVGRAPQAIALSADASRVAVADGGAIYVSRPHALLAEGSPLIKLSGNAAISEDMLEFLGPASNRLISGTGTSVTLWDTHQQSRISSTYRTAVPFCADCAPGVDISHDGRHVAVASGGEAIILELQGPSPPTVIQEDSAYWSLPVWSPTDDRLFLPDVANDEIQVWDVSGDGRIIERWPFQTHALEIVADGISADGKRLVVVDDDGGVQVFDTRTGRVTSKLSVDAPQGLAKMVTWVEFALDEDASEIAVATDKTVKVTKIPSDEERTLPLAAVEELTLAGNRLAGLISSTTPGTPHQAEAPDRLTSSRRLLVWDADTGKRIWSDPGAGGYIAGPFLSKSGRLVAAQRLDGVVIVTDVNRGEEVARFQLSGTVDDQRLSLRFDDTETKAISVTKGQVQVWGISPSTWIDSACRAAGRRLTAQEVHQLSGIRGLKIEACEESD
jgi:WD40 repeat protein